MSIFEENGNLIKTIRSGEHLDEIMSHAIDCLYREGPTNTVILEILSYVKLFHNEYFKRYENDVIEIMGLFFKRPSPTTMQGLIFDMYNDYIKDKWGANYTPMQASVLKTIAQNKWVSFSAPTSTGKSYIFRHLVENSQNDIAIIVPSRALINEYLDRIKEIVDVKRVNVLTFVDHINTKYAERYIFILTPERARELFKNQNWLNLDYILFDEAQLSDEDSTRGLYFDSIVRRSFKAFHKTKFIFAHPFIANPEAQLEKNKIVIGDDTAAFQYRQKNVGQIFYLHDTQKQEFYHLGTDAKILGNKLKSNFDPVENALKSNKTVLIYVSKASILNKSIFTQFKKYIDLCSPITNPDAKEMIEVLRDFIGASKNDKEYYNSELIDLLSRGIVTHHGSIPLAARTLLEHFTQRRYCRICFATSTLEQGINMPFDVVYIDRFPGSRSLSVKNLIGRAGRSSPHPTLDIGSVVVKNSNAIKLRKILQNEDVMSDKSKLDEADDGLDEKYREFKEAINNGTFNDEYNLTEKDLDKIRSDELMTQLPNLLDMMFNGDSLITTEELNHDIYESFHKLYEIYLGRQLVKAEKDTITQAIKIMLWKVSGRTFKKICQYRYAYAAKVSERRKSKNDNNIFMAQYMTRYNDIPNIRETLI